MILLRFFCRAMHYSEVSLTIVNLTLGEISKFGVKDAEYVHCAKWYTAKVLYITHSHGSARVL